MTLVRTLFISLAVCSGAFAQAPDGKSVTPGDAKKSHWAFQPVVRPAVPAGTWGRNPIDRFIGARLAAAKLEPSVEADRRDLPTRWQYKRPSWPRPNLRCPSR